MAGRRDRARRVSGTLVTTCAVVLLGLGVARLTSGGTLGLGAADGGLSGCSVADVRLSPALDYSARSQGYVISSVSFEELPAVCHGSTYRLTFAARSGSPILELVGVIGESEPGVSIPEARRPRADEVATTSLSVEADESAS